MAEPLNATFFAFRKREGGGVLLGASIAYVIALILFFVVIGGVGWALLGGSEFVQWYVSVMQAQANGQEPSAPPNAGAVFMIFPLYTILLFGVFIIFASFESACLRWMIRGERSGPLNLHFGADMWRVYGTYWVWFLFFLLSGILFFVALAVIGIAAAATGGKDSIAGGILILLFCLAWVVGWILTATRLAPAAATTIGIGQFAPLKAWKVSSGRFWPLFGTFVLLLILYLIVWTVVAAIFLGPFYGALLGQIDWAAIQNNDPAGFSRAYEEASMRTMQSTFSTPTMLALYVGGQLALGAVAMVFYLLYFGVNARAVQAALEEGKIERAAAT